MFESENSFLVKEKLFKALVCIVASLYSDLFGLIYAVSEINVTLLKHHYFSKCF